MLSDYSDILEISKHIWDGNDYLPQRINKFYEDVYSFPMVIEDGGKVVCVGNMRFISNDIIWLEAIRTHPSSRSKGFATKLTQRQIEKSKSLGAKQVWLVTSVDNNKTRKMLDRLEFIETGLICIWGYQDDHDEDPNSAKPSDLDKNGNLKNIDALEKYCDKDTKSLASKWKKCRTKDQIKNILYEINYDYIIGEFHIYSPDCFIIDKLIELGKIYCIKDPDAILVLKESDEYADAVIIGISTNEPKAIESGLLFARDKLLTSNIKLFFPASIKHNLFENWKLRIMEKKIR